MPEISRFFGIVIKMYIDDHPPPHFHAEDGEHEAIVGIRSLTVTSSEGYQTSQTTIGGISAITIRSKSGLICGMS